MIDEANVNRLIAALGIYASNHNGMYPPVDQGAMLEALGRVQVTLAARGNDVDSRINRLFHDDLPAQVQPLINLSRALVDYDDGVQEALLYLDGYIWGD